MSKNMEQYEGALDVRYIDTCFISLFNKLSANVNNIV